VLQLRAEAQCDAAGAGAKSCWQLFGARWQRDGTDCAVAAKKMQCRRELQGRRQFAWPQLGGSSVALHSDGAAGCA
jgi:hypothetical protein